MNQIYLWCVTGMAALLSLNTLFRLVSDRQLLTNEDLSDSDRAFAWRVVVFLVFPLLTFLDLRSTIVSCQWLGGYVKDCTYGLLWYHCTPLGLVSLKALLVVMFAGFAVQLLLAVCLLPSLCFRPHPFLATVIGYAVAFTFGFNLILDPLMAAAGMGSPRWQLLYSIPGKQEQLLLIAAQVVAALLFLGALRSTQMRLWFASISRPHTSDKLKRAVAELKANPSSLNAICRVGLLYDRIGLPVPANQQLQQLTKQAPGSLYCQFLQALMAYRRRRYQAAQQAFLGCAEDLRVTGVLKANLLSAAACSAFAAGQPTAALNLSERALEFAHDCLVARMVKVDVLLKEGKKDQAGEEILQAIRSGAGMDLENKVPLDAELTFELLSRLEQSSPAAAPTAVLTAGQR